MAVPANTVQTFARANIREQLSDIITMVDPTDVPFYSTAKKGTAKSRTPEWQNDTLADPDIANANIEGDDASNDTTAASTRIKNVVQLLDKVVQVSTTARAVETAGYEDELERQVLKKGKELKRDIEAIITGNFASVLGAAGTAGKCGGAEAMIKTNFSRGATGASGGYNTGTGLVVAATDGTTRTATEAQLKDVVQQIWNTSGAKADMIMVNGAMKQKYSAFAGIATQYRDNPGMKAAVIIAAADVYKSDFGLHTIVPNRFIGYSATRTRNATTSNQTALVLDMSSWKVRFLQAMKTDTLAKTGHSDRRMISCELTLECDNEKKNGVVADITV